MTGGIEDIVVGKKWSLDEDLVKKQTLSKHT